MATRKQIEESYLKLSKHLRSVRREIHKSNKFLPEIPNGKIQDRSIFSALYRLEERVDAEFHDPLAEAIMADLRKKAGGH